MRLWQLISVMMILAMPLHSNAGSEMSISLIKDSSDVVYALELERGSAAGPIRVSLTRLVHMVLGANPYLILPSSSPVGLIAQGPANESPFRTLDIEGLKLLSPKNPELFKSCKGLFDKLKLITQDNGLSWYVADFACVEPRWQAAPKR
jgi:hypothetical protein